jgi:hypothetical protein
LPATSQSSKLAELRSRTDRDLVAVIENALDRGLLLAYNEPDVDPAGVLHRRAAKIYTDASMLVAVVENVTGRRRLRGKLTELRNALDRQLQVQIARASA